MKVIINSLPKSGTHLLVRLLNLIGMKETKPNLAAGQVRLTNKNPIKIILKKRRIWLDGMNNTGIMIDIDNPINKVCKDWIIKILNKTPNNSFHKAHMPYSIETEKIINSLNYKILFIIRDPRDVAISHYNWVMKHPENPEYKYVKKLNNDYDIVSHVLNGKVFNNGYFLAPLRKRIENVLGWLESSNTTSVKFENLIGEKGGSSKDLQIESIKKIFKYLEIQFDDDFLNYAVENIFYKKSTTFNKGKIGQWKTYFSEETKKIFKENCGDLLIKLHYEADFSW